MNKLKVLHCKKWDTIQIASKYTSTKCTVSQFCFIFDAKWYIRHAYIFVTFLVCLQIFIPQNNNSWYCQINDHLIRFPCDLELLAVSLESTCDIIVISLWYPCIFFHQLFEFIQGQFLHRDVIWMQPKWIKIHDVIGSPISGKNATKLKKHIKKHFHRSQLFSCHLFN